MWLYMFTDTGSLAVSVEHLLLLKPCTHHSTSVHTSFSQHPSSNDTPRESCFFKCWVCTFVIGLFLTPKKGIHLVTFSLRPLHKGKKEKQESFVTVINTEDSGQQQWTERHCPTGTERPTSTTSPQKPSAPHKLVCSLWHIHLQSPVHLVKYFSLWS